jgi:3-oxoacyl-[acyl-carrier-protein] synthase I
MIPLAIKAAGMVTAVGFNAASSCAAMRAGIRCVNETNLWDAESGEYLAAGRVLLPHWWVGTGKFAELVAPAIHECMLAAAPVRPEEIPILIGLPSEGRPCRFADLDAKILSEIEYRLDYPLHRNSRVIPQDRVSTLVAISEAERLIADGSAQLCVIAAVDSLVQQDLVEHYLANRRLLTPKNSNGFSPGEAGGALLVGRQATPETAELQVLGIGMGWEPATIESDQPLRGEGLTAAVSGALETAGLTMQDAHYRITDLNGEHYRFKEMTLVMTRFPSKPKPKVFDLWHPIEFIGDVGAAIGPVVLGVAFYAGCKDYSVGSTVLCTFGNDDGARAAALVRFRTEN